MTPVATEEKAFLPTPEQLKEEKAVLPTKEEKAVLPPSEEKAVLPPSEEKAVLATSDMKKEETGGAKGLKTLLLEKEVEEKEVRLLSSSFS